MAQNEPANLGSDLASRLIPPTSAVAVCCYSSQELILSQLTKGGRLSWPRQCSKGVYCSGFRDNHIYPEISHIIVEHVTSQLLWWRCIIVSFWLNNSLLFYRYTDKCGGCHAGLSLKLKEFHTSGIVFAWTLFLQLIRQGNEVFVVYAYTFDSFP